MYHSAISFLYILSNRLRCFRGIFFILSFVFSGLLFLPHGDPRKEAKEGRLVSNSFVIQFVRTGLNLITLWFERTMIMDINITQATINDIGQLQKIGRQTFYETFSDSNTEENMISYLEDKFSIEKLSSELNDKNAEFYFAKIDNDVVGYLKLNSGQSQTELKEDKALEVERIYVLKEFHGKKVGQVLYDKAIEIAKQKNADYIWLGVWEENPRAIGFYKKNGFVAFDKHIFKLGSDEQTDIMMKLKLSKGG